MIDTARLIVEYSSRVLQNLIGTYSANHYFHIAIGTKSLLEETFLSVSAVLYS